MKDIFKLLTIVLVLITLISCQTMDADSMKVEPDAKIDTKPTQNKSKSTSSVDASSKKVRSLTEENVIGSYWLNSLNDLDNNVLMTKKDIGNVFMFQCDPNFALLEDGTVTHLVSFACPYGKWDIKDNNIEIITDNGSIETYTYDNGYLYRKVKVEKYISHLDTNPFDSTITDLIEYYEKAHCRIIIILMKIIFNILIMTFVTIK